MKNSRRFLVFLRRNALRPIGGLRNCRFFFFLPFFNLLFLRRRFTGDASFTADAQPRSDSLHSLSPRSPAGGGGGGGEALQPKLAEARARMETLSREIGVKTAELELLRTKKAQESRLADVQLEATRRELQVKLDELTSTREELSSLRQERDRLTNELNSARQIAAPTTGDIPTISKEVLELTQQLQNLQIDIHRNKEEISQLDRERKAKVWWWIKLTFILLGRKRR